MRTEENKKTGTNFMSFIFLFFWIVTKTAYLWSETTRCFPTIRGLGPKNKRRNPFPIVFGQSPIVIFHFARSVSGPGHTRMCKKSDLSVSFAWNPAAPLVSLPKSQIEDWLGEKFVFLFDFAFQSWNFFFLFSFACRGMLGAAKDRFLSGR